MDTTSWPFEAADPVAKHEHDTPEWHAARSAGLGGSDAAVIMGDNPYKTMHELLLDKLGLGERFDGNDLTRCGQLLEDAIIDALGDVMPANELGSMRSKAHPFLLGNVDGLRGDELVEIKTAGRRWRSVPGYYVAQVQHYMIVTGCRRATIYCWHTDIDRATLVKLVEAGTITPAQAVSHGSIDAHVLLYDEAWAARYVERARRFWDDVERERARQK